MGKKLFVIFDASSVLYRCYFALPKLMTKNGKIVNALYGFLVLFFKILREFKPHFVAVCFDFPGKTFRHEFFKEYKAQRPKIPNELSLQIEDLKYILKKFRVSFFEKEGFEADDVIATISKRVEKEENLEKIIVTGDSDLFQLVDQRTKIYFLRKKSKKQEILGEKEIEEILGFEPKKIIIYKVLKGDTSDNVRGIEGLTTKKIKKLLEKIKDTKDLFNPENFWQLTEDEKKILLKNKEKIQENFELLSLKYDLPLDFELEDCRISLYNKEEAKVVLENFGFKSLLKRLEEITIH